MKFEELQVIGWGKSEGQRQHRCMANVPVTMITASSPAARHSGRSPVGSMAQRSRATGIGFRVRLRNWLVDSIKDSG